MNPIQNLPSPLSASSVQALHSQQLDTAGPSVPSALVNANGSNPDAETPNLKETFTQFVGETFYGQLIKSMRQTVGKPSYMHGGRAEEIFQGQLDQLLSEHMTEASADQIAGPMFELYNLSAGR